MMATTIQHDVFNGNTTAGLFINDFSSANEVERQTRLAEAKKAAEDKQASEAAELLALRKRCADLEAAAKTLTEPLDYDNDLDPSFHGEVVQFVLVANFRTGGFDMGANHGASSHGFTFGPDYSWQKITLSKVDPKNRKSPWLIRSKIGKYLDFVKNGQDGIDVVHSDLKLGGEQKEQEGQQFKIGRVPGGGFKIENVRWGMLLQMEEPFADKNDKKMIAQSYRPADGDSQWKWFIIAW